MKKREELQKGMASDIDEFIFYAYVPDRASNDFDRRGSIWTVFMVNEKGGRIDPMELRRIEPITPVIKEFSRILIPTTEWLTVFASLCSIVRGVI